MSIIGATTSLSMARMRMAEAQVEKPMETDGICSVAFF